MPANPLLRYEHPIENNIGNQAQGPVINARVAIAPPQRDTIAPAVREPVARANDQIPFFDRPFYSKIAISIGAVIITPYYLGKKLIKALPEICQFIGNNIIQPIFNKTIDALLWVNQKIITPILNTLEHVLNVLKPVYEVAKIVFKQAMNQIENGLNILYKEVFIPALRLAFITIPKNTFTYILKPLHKYVLKPTYKVAKFVWNQIKPTLTILKNQAVKAISISWNKVLYPYLIKPLYNKAIEALELLIKDVFKPALENIVKPALKFAFITAPIFIYKNAYQPIESLISTAYNTVQESIIELYRLFISR